MECFIAVAQAEQYLNSILFCRFTDQYGLEPAGQSRIFFYMFFIFIQCRRTDALQFSPGQSRFQDVGGIHGTFHCAGADELMQFVNEENHMGIILYSFYHFFDAFFKFATVFCASDETGKIQGKYPFICQNIRYDTAYDTLGQAFGNGRLSYAGGTD